MFLLLFWGSFCDCCQQSSSHQIRQSRQEALLVKIWNQFISGLMFVFLQIFNTSFLMKDKNRSFQHPLSGERDYSGEHHANDIPSGLLCKNCRLVGKKADVPIPKEILSINSTSISILVYWWIIYKHVEMESERTGNEFWMMWLLNAFCVIQIDLSQLFHQYQKCYVFCSYIINRNISSC